MYHVAQYDKTTASPRIWLLVIFGLFQITQLAICASWKDDIHAFIKIYGKSFLANRNLKTHLCMQIGPFDYYSLARENIIVSDRFLVRVGPWFLRYTACSVRKLVDRFSYDQVNGIPSLDASSPVFQRWCSLQMPNWTFFRLLKVHGMEFWSSYPIRAD